MNATEEVQQEVQEIRKLVMERLMPLERALTKIREMTEPAMVDQNTHLRIRELVSEVLVEIAKAETMPPVKKLDRKFYGVIYKAKDDKRVPDDEWMVLLAKDDVAASVLPIYRERCIEFGCDDEQIAGITDLIERFTAWRKTHPERCLKPGLKGERLVA